MKILEGVGRKASLPVLGVAAVGWSVFAIGFWAFNNGDNFYNDIRKDKTFTTDEDLGFPDNKFPLPLADKFVEENYPAQRANPDFFAYWCYIVSFPILLVVLVLHLILHNLYIFGVVGHFLLGVCLVSGSGVFWVNGRYLFSEDNNLRRRGFLDTFPKDWRTDSYYGLWLVVEWVGVIICILAMIAYMVLIPFYTASCKRSNYEDLEGHEMEER